VKDRILITGGAGFIGRHLAMALLKGGYGVVALDAMIEQVHVNGAAGVLPRDVELVRGDMRDEATVRSSLRGINGVVHLAAEVGVGQSMYAIERYVSVNDVGTAVLLEQLARSSVRRIVVASSMSIYGEGRYRSAAGPIRDDVERAACRAGAWDPADEAGPLMPLPTPEVKRPSLASVYALTKYVQERMTLMMAQAYGIEGCALRLFNVYGPGQALSNPYTGVLANFASRLRNGRRPLLYEDGGQRRDFVHVSDVTQAFVLALEHPAAAGGVFNIGSGHNHTILDVAHRLATSMGRPGLVPEVVGKARAGDVRHCFADISLAREKLGYQPSCRLGDGLGELIDWVNTQQTVDRVSEARMELEKRGLVA
jgi:dTDP-L-rhamnose 4-epimerase